MDECTHKVRAEYWKGIIEACHNRPEGQSAKSWLSENGITEQSYYHWQRKFRQQTYEVMQGSEAAVPKTSEISFIEMPCVQPNPIKTEHSNCQTVAVIQTTAMKIEITNAISESILARILREVSHA